MRADTAQLFNTTPGLKRMLIEPEDDGEERFVDAPEAGEAVKVVVVNADEKADDGYDGKKREPLYAKAETSCLWEIVSPPLGVTLFVHLPTLSRYHIRPLCISPEDGPAHIPAPPDTAFPPFHLPPLDPTPLLPPPDRFSRYRPKHPNLLPR